MHDLGLRSMADATPERLKQVVDACASYFAGCNAFWRWFRVLDRLLDASTDGRFTYRDKGACHLDLVQWATDPVWRDLTPDARSAPLVEGAPHLRRQLEHHAGIRVVLPNGVTVVEQGQEVGLADLKQVGSVRPPGQGRGLRPSCTSVSHGQPRSAD